MKPYGNRLPAIGWAGRAAARAACAAFLLIAGMSSAMANTCTANVAAGNWNTAGTWTTCGGVVPTAADDVVIPATRTVTMDTSPTIRTLNISGSLLIGSNTTARTLTVTIAGGGGNITINAGGSMTTNAFNATHSLVMNGDFVNNGTLNLATTAARLCNTTFNRNGNQTVSGAGAFTFNGITLNMGATNANILDVQSNITVPANFLTITNGTYKHSNSSNITPWTADPAIPASGGFWLNAAATVTTTGINVTLNGGTLRISAGTMNIGNSDATLLRLGNFATTLFQMDGGALTVTGGINSTANAGAGTFTMSGGTITLQTIDAGPVYTFLLGSATTLNWSGGTIIAVNGDNTTDDVDIRSSTQNITGGTLQLGSAATTSANDISYINGAGGQLNVWNLVLASGPARNIQLRSSTNILNDLTIQTLNNLNPSAGLAINIGAGNASGNWINNGTFTQGTTTVTFTGTSPTPAIGGTTATTFNNFVINKASNNLAIATSPTINGTLTFTSGDLVTGANRVIFGTAGVSSGPSASSYVFGTVQKNYSAAGTFVFPVGDASNYTPVSIQGTAGFTAGNLSINTTGTDHPQVTTPIPSTGIDANQSVNRYWTLTASGLPAASTYNATFNFINGVPVDLDAAATPASFIVQRYDGTNWNPTTLGTAGATSTSITGVANVYGDFAIGAPLSNFNGAPGAFNAFETTTPSGAILGRIYTKLVGTSFTVSIVAVSNNAVNTAPLTTPLTVAIIDASPTSGTMTAASNCRTSWTTVIQSQTVPAAVGWVGGRVNVTITAPTVAVRNARIRVTQGALVGCSTDNFAIRPTAFTITSTNATQTNSSGTPVIKTGANFNLTASSVAGYDGTPTLDNTKVVGTPTAGTIGGSFSAAPVGTGTASGSSFFYSDVGNIGLAANAVVDSGFTAVDQTTDCVTSSTSNTLSAGMYGCSTGSNAVAQTLGSSGFGRFIPDNFAVSLNSPTFAPACSSGGFTYVGQTFAYSTLPTITVTARNGTNNGLTNATTANYAGAYMKFSNTSGTSLNQAPYNTQAGRYTWFDALGGGTTPSLNVVPSAVTSDPAIGTFSAGVGTLTFGSGVTFTFTRPAAPSLPFAADISLALNVVDSDGVQPASNPVAFGAATAGNGIAFTPPTANQMRFGRMRLGNANGSALLNLAIPLSVEYFTTGGAFATNTLDSCTTISATNISMTFQATTPTLVACETGLSPTGTISFTSGKAALKLTKPGAGNGGAVNLSVILNTPTGATTCAPASSATSSANLPWLQGNWLGGGYTADPVGQATFDVLRGADEFIYLRENF